MMTQTTVPVSGQLDQVHDTSFYGCGGRAGAPTSTMDMETPSMPALTGVSPDGEVDTEFLIIGCGPAGASLACFLASYGAWTCSLDR